MRSVILFFLVAFSCFGQESTGIEFAFRGSSAYVTDPSSTQCVIGVTKFPYLNLTTSTIGFVSATSGSQASGQAITGCNNTQRVLTFVPILNQPLAAEPSRNNSRATKSTVHRPDCWRF